MNAPLSFAELSARQRVQHLLDAGTFTEILGPAQRVVSPHLALLGVPYAFDDGVVIGSGMLQGQPAAAKYAGRHHCRLERVTGTVSTQGEWDAVHL